MFEQTYYPVDSTFHRALTAYYGGQLRRVLNELTSLICKCAQAGSSLKFLLECRCHEVYPNFICRSLKFSLQGVHLEKLVQKLPAHIL